MMWDGKDLKNKLDGKQERPKMPPIPDYLQENRVLRVFHGLGQKIADKSESMEAKEIPDLLQEHYPDFSYSKKEIQAVLRSIISGVVMGDGTPEMSMYLAIAIGYLMGREDAAG